jgi:anti-anti-sigma factor
VTAPIEVEILSADSAIISLRGEHDLDTRPLIESALAAVSSRAYVVLDLSACTFADTTVISSMTRAVRTKQAANGELVLVAPAPRTPALRALELMGIDQILTFHACRDAALAAIWRARHQHIAAIGEDGADLRRSA